MKKHILFYLKKKLETKLFIIIVCVLLLCLPYVRCCCTCTWFQCRQRIKWQWLKGAAAWQFRWEISCLKFIFQGNWWVTTSIDLFECLGYLTEISFKHLKHQLIPSILTIYFYKNKLALDGEWHIPMNYLFNFYLTLILICLLSRITIFHDERLISC